MCTRFSYLKRSLRTFELRILTKNTKSIFPGFKPGTFGSKEQRATRTLSWQYERQSIELETIQTRHSWSPVMPIQNHMAISPCKIGLSLFYYGNYTFKI